MYKPKKLIMSIFTLGLTVATLTTSTYAWFSRNSETWVDDFNVDIENTENLLISVDNNIYKSSLNQDDIKKAISAKLLGKDINSLTDEEIEEYSKISLSTVSTSDLENFTTIDSKVYSDGYYTSTEASKYSYVSFDLWFRKESTQEIVGKEFDLMFVDDAYVSSHNDSVASATSITGNDETIKLNNSLKALVDGEVKEYNANDEFTINPANAIRIGVYGYQNDTSYIYEPNEGYGSYAYTDNLDDNSKYDPNCSPMVTYFNNIYKYKLKPLDEKITSYSLADKALDSFVITQDEKGNQTYTDVHITVYIWLEGYDADYLPGIDVSSITSYLSFYAKEKNENTEEVSE